MFEVPNSTKLLIMKKIEATVTRAKDGFFNVNCNDEMFSGGGDTLEAAEDDMLEQMRFFKETSLEDNFDYPAFLDDNFEVIY